MPVEQSAYRRNHSTETALLRVISDLLNSMDKQEVTLLRLLDLSAAFDCVDHDILLSRLERDVWHWGFGNRMDTILPRGPDAASGIPWSAVWHPEVGFRRPTRFHAWSTTVPALHGRIAGHHQGPRYEGALLCWWHAGTCQHWSRGRRDGCPKVRQLHGEDRILDEQQQTEDECWQNTGDMDRIQTTACQSRHQGVPAAVCQHSIFHHSVQSRCSSRQSAHHAGSCGGNVPLVFLSAEAAADYPEFVDNRCCQDVGTGVCRRSAWLLQQSTVRCQRRTPATSAKCPERGCTVHHWYSEIRSHHASVAQPSLVASATKDNFQDRHSDVPMFEWTGTFLSGSRLHRSFCDTRSETVAICHLRAAVHSKNQNSDTWTEVIQGLWSNNLEWSSR